MTMTKKDFSVLADALACAIEHTSNVQETRNVLEILQEYLKIEYSNFNQDLFHAHITKRINDNHKIDILIRQYVER